MYPNKTTIARDMLDEWANPHRWLFPTLDRVRSGGRDTWQSVWRESCKSKEISTGRHITGRHSALPTCTSSTWLLGLPCVALHYPGIAVYGLVNAALRCVRAKKTNHQLPQETAAVS